MKLENITREYLLEYSTMKPKNNCSRSLENHWGDDVPERLYWF